MGGKRRERIKIGLALLLACAPCAPRSADAQSVCKSCEVQVGLGGTYHYWGTTGGVVLPVSLTWSENRYELEFVRVTTQQTLRESGSRDNRLMAAPYWGVSLSRRWQLFERGPVKGFFGFGMAGKTKSDALRDRKSTRLNSSHRCISYAVFCLKKKKKQKTDST